MNALMEICHQYSVIVLEEFHGSKELLLEKLQRFSMKFSFLHSAVEDTPNAGGLPFMISKSSLLGWSLEQVNVIPGRIAKVLASRTCDDDRWCCFVSHLGSA